MQVDRSEAGPVTSPKRSRDARVRGLGLCDALHIEFGSCQIPGLLAEIEQQIGSLHEARHDAQRRLDEVRKDPSSASMSLRAAEEEVSSHEYGLQALSSITRQLRPVTNDGSVIVAGPSKLLSELVVGATMDAAQSLTEALHASPRDDAASRDELRAAAVAVAAWIDTYTECQAVEWFSFDVALDAMPVEGSQRRLNGG